MGLQRRKEGQPLPHAGLLVLLHAGIDEHADEPRHQKRERSQPGQERNVDVTAGRARNDDTLPGTSFQIENAALRAGIGAARQKMRL